MTQLTKSEKVLAIIVGVLLVAVVFTLSTRRTASIAAKTIHPGAIVCAIDSKMTETIPYDNVEYLGNGDWKLYAGEHQTVFRQAMIESCIAIPGYVSPPPVRPSTQNEDRAYWEHKLPFYNTGRADKDGQPEQVSV